MGAFFSIVMPTYNRAGLIGQAIESVLGQSFKEWELVIVDDGSTDNTKEVVLAYNDPRIKYIFQQNAERSVARNNGIDNSTGTYICFLDSDDYYLTHRLRLLYEQIISRNQMVAFYYTGIAYKIDGHVSDRPELKNETDNIFDFIVQAIIGTPQVCIHRNLLSENRFDPQFHIGEDMELWLRIAVDAAPQYLENQFTVVAVEHNDRSVNVRRYNSYQHQLRMLKRVFSADHPGHAVSGRIKKQLLSNCFFGIAKYYLYQGDRLSAMSNLLRAIFTDVKHFQNKYRLNLMLRLLQPNGTEKARRLLD